jgi:hypothetical protein
MDNFTIINLQSLMGAISIYLAFRWWIKPRLAHLNIHQALLPFVFLNAFRYLGLTFMSSHQFYDGFPSEFLNTVGIWDLATSVFAIIASLVLKANWKYALPLVWIFNIFGFADLLTAFPQFFSLELYNKDLGVIWLVFITFGIAAFLSHIEVFNLLIKHLKKK